MNNWYDSILKEFIPGIAPITLAADPDGLLLEENLLRQIRQKGFDLITYDNPVEFRFEYEAKYRDRLDKENLFLVLIVHAPAENLDTLPCDLLQNSRKISFSLSDLFPKLHCPVVAALDKGDLEALFNAQKFHNPGELAENGTKEFILRHIFGAAPELIKEPKDLLRELLRLHYRGRFIPATINERFIQILRQKQVFSDWPLEKIIPNREDFFAFLQKGWALFLEQMAGGKENGAAAALPFDHDDIRIYIHNLFNEGFLKSIPFEKANQIKESWVKTGIFTDREKENKRRFSGLLESVKESIPTSEARHMDWRQFAFRWAELSALFFCAAAPLTAAAKNAFRELRAKVDNSFTTWMQKRCAGLINLPPLQPVMLHHIPRFLSHRMISSEQKIALILVDGLSLELWTVLRKCLSSQDPQLFFQENTLFAWAPTLSSVSRQALFAGKPPFYFPTSIDTTNREEALWSKCWLDQGLGKDEILYRKGLNEKEIEPLRESLSHPKTRIAGLVIDKIDKIMHGMELGGAGMFNQVEQWAKQGFLSQFIELLFRHGYTIYLTSDHGSIEAEGCGKPAEGVLAEHRGQRARIYPDHLLRKKIKEKFPEAIEWPSIGLPENYLPLLAPNRLAFVKEKQRIVCHGGISIEEVIVPFVKINRKT